MHIANKLIFSAAVVRDKLSIKPSKIFKWRFGDVVYRKYGKGTPLLLIHHLSPVGNQYEWERLIPFLQKEHTVYTLDLIGCGKSDKPSLSYTNYMFAQLVQDFTKQVIKEKTCLITSGNSSSIAITAAYLSQENYKNLIFINPEYSADVSMVPDKKSKIFKFILEIPILGTFFYNVSTSKYRLMNVIPSKFVKYSDCIKLSDIQAFYEAAHLKGASSRFLMASIEGHYTNYNIYPFLKGLKQEIALFYGDDMKDAKEEITFYQSIQPSIKGRLIPGARFLPHMEVPQTVSKKILDFLN